MHTRTHTHTYTRYLSLISHYLSAPPVIKPLPSLSARARRRVLDAEGKNSITFQDMREGFECNFFLLGLQARLPADVTGHVAGHKRPRG